MSFLKSYESLSSSSSRADVSKALQSIINAPPFSLTSPARETLVQVLLDDISILLSKGKNGRLTKKDAQLALLALKTLGRNTPCSRIIAKRENLQVLLTAAQKLRAASDNDAAEECFRCVANGLLLVEDARSTWVEIKGAEFCVDVLQDASSPNLLFLMGRILFLSTASSMSSFIPTLLDAKSPMKHDIVEIIGRKLDTLLPLIKQNIPMSKEAMTDLLKLSFNLLCHWPKIAPDAESSVKDAPSSSKGKGRETMTGNLDDPPVLGERWSSRLNGLLPPLRNVYLGLPVSPSSPLAPPMSHILHSLLPIPFSAELESTWFPQTESTNVPAVLTRSSTLLDTSLEHYMPGAIEPDDDSVKQRCVREDVELDHALSPLVILLTNICKHSVDCRKNLREHILPTNLERTSPLEGRANTLGRCIRLMACVHHQRLRETSGELLFVLCDSDAQILTTQIGYGNAAGYLFNRGLLAAPPTQASGAADELASDSTSGPRINPITGVVEQPRAPGPEMTDEEKEREAEKLFVLFERLEKAGGGENPIKKALREGKLEKYNEERRKKDEGDDD